MYIPPQHCTNKGIAGDLLVIHGLSGATLLHGIGEAMALKIGRKGRFSLGAIGDVEASMDSVMSQAVAFMLHMERLSSHAKQRQSVDLNYGR